MATTPLFQQAVPWLDALAASSARLRELVGDLTVEQLMLPSFARGWTIAQVLSHLGSAAEICTILVAGGLGGEPCGLHRDQLLKIWAHWDSLTPEAQLAGWRRSDRAHLSLLRSIAPAQAQTLRVPHFSGPLTLTEYAGYRLSEQSLHTWDIDVALDQRSVIPSDESSRLLSRINLVTSRFRDGATLDHLRTKEIAVRLTDTDQAFSLHLGAECQLLPAQCPNSAGTVVATADELVRLIYGRHRATDGVEVTGAVTLDDLIRLFPGF